MLIGTRIISSPQFCQRINTSVTHVNYFALVVMLQAVVKLLNVISSRLKDVRLSQEHHQVHVHLTLP